MNKLSKLLYKFNAWTISLLGSNRPHSKGDMSLESYSVTDRRFAARYKQVDKTYAYDIIVDCGEPTAGFFGRGDNFSNPLHGEKRRINSLSSGLYSVYDKTATGAISAIAKRIRHSGFNGIVEFAKSVVSVINEGEIDLSFSNSVTPLPLYPLSQIAASAYKYDHGDASATPYKPFDPSLKNRLAEISSPGKYTREWHSPTGLSIEEFHEKYRPSELAI